MAVEVRLPAFEGPLDLLLHLIEKNQVDIYDIPVYEITQQYLACLDEWNKKNMEIASEFIVMAATLINIKAKMLVPVQKEEEEEEDPREELIRRLLEYKRYKEAAKEFRQLEPDPDRLWVCRDPEKIRIPAPKPSFAQLLSGVTLQSLYETYAKALKSQRESIDPLRSTFRSVARDSYTIEEKIQDLMRTLQALETVSYYSLRAKSKSRQEEITYFLAMLELNRSAKVYLQQEKAFADIIVLPRKELAAAVSPDQEEPAYPAAWVRPETEFARAGGEPGDNDEYEQWEPEAAGWEPVPPGGGEPEPKKEYAASA